LRHAALLFSFAPFGRLLRDLELVEQRVEPLEIRVPHLPITLDPQIRGLEGLCLEVTRPPLRISAARDEPRALEHLEVLRDRRLAHIERLGELVDRGIAGSQTREYRAPCRIGEGGEDRVELRRGKNRVLHNYLVI